MACSLHGMIEQFHDILPDEQMPCHGFRFLPAAAGRVCFVRGARPLGPPRALDSPVVPEPGTAAASGGRRQFWPAAFAASRRLAGTSGALMGLATRKPMLLFSFVGSLLFRFEERKLFSVLFQLPPRIARFSDVFGPGAR